MKNSSSGTSKYASIDIGSNSMLLLVASRKNGLLIPELEKIVDLKTSAHLDENGDLNSDIVQTILSELESMLSLISKYRAKIVSVMGTQIFRSVKNGQMVMDKISNRFNLPGKIITGEQEAELSLIAIKSQCKSNQLMVVDIGAQSTELSSDHFKKSYAVGCLSLLKECGHDGIKIKNNISNALQIRPVDNVKELVGVGGTCTTLAMIKNSRKNYVASEINGTKISSDEISSWADTWERVEDFNKFNLVGLPKNRTEMMHGGIMILKHILRSLNISMLSISTWSIRHGSIIAHG